MTMRALGQVAVGILLITGVAWGPGARLSWAQPPVTTPAPIAAERDALIGKIARGEDFEASVARFAALWREVTTQREASAQVAQQAHDQQQQALKELQEQQHSLDYLVAQHCFLRADPSQPSNLRTSDLLRADWGKVVRKEAVTIQGKNAFAEDEHAFVYLVKGGERTYALSSKAPTLYLGKGLQAAVGDLVLLCWVGLSSYGSGSYFPEGFRDNVVSQGFAARIAAPPRIAAKTKWNPLHLTGESALRMAIERVKWEYPEERPVVSYIHVLADLGGGRFEIAAQRQSYILQLPGGLKNRELVQPGKYLWAIMSAPVFDKGIKKLVLRAEDLEAHYVQPLD